MYAESTSPTVDEDPAMIAEQAIPEPKPLAERLRKNILKVKKEAIEELLALVRASPKEFEPYIESSLDFLSYKDLVVQDRGLKILVLFPQDGNPLTVDPKQMIKTLIEKCLCLEKEEIKSNAGEVLFWYMDHSYEDLLVS